MNGSLDVSDPLPAMLGSVYPPSTPLPSRAVYSDCPEKVSDFHNRIREINPNPIHKPEECEFQAKVVLNLVNMHAKIRNTKISKMSH